MFGIFNHHTATRMALVGLVSGAAAFVALPTQAAVIQQVSVSFDPTPGDIANGDDRQDVDSTNNLGGPIVDPIFAQIVGDRFNARGSVGPFGNLGLEGATISVGEMRAQADVESNEFVNLSPRAQEARINFIIDGGEFNLIGGAGSSMRFLLTVNSSIEPLPVFQTGFRLTTGQSSALDTTFELIGDDIGITNPTSTQVLIPLTFASASLGVIQPNEQFGIDYQASIFMDVDGFAEVANFAFSDPFDVSDLGDFPTVEFVDVAAIPLPAGAPMLLGAVGVLGLIGARRARRSSGAPAIGAARE